MRSTTFCFLISLMRHRNEFVSIKYPYFESYSLWFLCSGQLEVHVQVEHGSHIMKTADLSSVWVLEWLSKPEDPNSTSNTRKCLGLCVREINKYCAESLNPEFFYKLALIWVTETLSLSQRLFAEQLLNVHEFNYKSKGGLGIPNIPVSLPETTAVYVQSLPRTFSSFLIIFSLSHWI